MKHRATEPYHWLVEDPQRLERLRQAATRVLGPVLLGARGVGKSRLAPALAARLGFLALDADRELERRIGCNIGELLARDGEARFRELESELLGELLERPGLVLATGGGCVLAAVNRVWLEPRFCIWLDAPTELLAQRIRGSQRPSLSGAPVEEELFEQCRARAPLYRALASVRLDASLDSAVLLSAAEAATRRYLELGS